MVSKENVGAPLIYKKKTKNKKTKTKTSTIIIKANYMEASLTRRLRGICNLYIFWNFRLNLYYSDSTFSFNLHVYNNVA